MRPDYAHLVRRTLDRLVAEHADARPDAVALVDRSRSLTWAELERAVGAVAAGLRARGLRHGGLVAALPRRTWELPVLFLATARAGGIFAPLDGRSDPARMAAALRGGVDVLFAAPEFEPTGVALAALLAGSGGSPRAIGAGDLVADIGGAAVAGGLILPPSDDPDSVCYFNYTSGSTGLPKAAPTTHAQVQWNTRAVLESFPFAADERFLCLFAAHSHPHEHFARPLAAGAVTLMVDTIRPRSVLRALRELGATWLFAVPTAFELLLAHVDEEGSPSTLRTCESGGAPVPPELVRSAERAFSCRFLPIWGCTETTGVALAVPADGAARRLELLGGPLRHYEARVADADPETGVGELCVRGPAVVQGYRDRADQAHRFQDGWYRTGDLVRAEDGGLFRFMGRNEEMVQVGGERVYLVDVERVVRALPGVREAVVVATPEPRGDVPRAVVVPAGGARLTRSEVLSFCRDHLPASAVPRRVEFIDEVPREASGRIDKRALAEDRVHPVAVAVNSMLIERRPIDEAFRLAARASQRVGIPVVVDLRSRRSADSDPDGHWAVAHDNAAFDLGCADSVDRAVALSRDYGVPVAMASAYAGACFPGDLAYGRRVIDQAYRLAEVAPEGTLVLRVLGGDLLARARSLPGRWQDVRRALREEALDTFRRWESHTRDHGERLGGAVLLGLEIHHGQYLADLHDVHHCCRGLGELGWQYVGFIDDPANRFIASDGDLLGAMDFARMVRAWGGRILAYHLKDVRYLAPWSQFHPQPFQRVGEPVFVWGTHKFEWTALGEGEVDLPQALMAAHRLSRPPHPWCLLSTEFVAASRCEADAEAIVQAYCRLAVEGAP